MADDREIDYVLRDEFYFFVLDFVDFVMIFVVRKNKFLVLFSLNNKFYV